MAVQQATAHRVLAVLVEAEQELIQVLLVMLVQQILVAVVVTFFLRLLSVMLPRCCC